jgi:two-component system response regulator VanR
MTTVLVADGDPDLRETVGDILEAEGYGVLKAQNGLEALDLLHATSPPLVVLLDLQMPQLDGPGCCVRWQRTRSWRPRTTTSS